MERDKCIVCGQKAGDSVNWAYFERGMSEKLFICDTCHSHKVNLLDFSIAEETYNASRSYMEARIEGKVSEIRSVVEAWINGEGNCYFPESEDLMYYAEGPEAHLFVFEDRVVILSSKVSLSYTEFDMSLAGFFSNREKERKEKDVYTRDIRINFGEQKREFAIYRHWALDEIKESDYRVSTARIDTDYVLDAKKPIELDISLGTYGVLNFNYEGDWIKGVEGTYSKSKVSFCFFYHQNQLMEEIYNYIQSRLNHAKENNKETSTPMQKVTASAARRMQAKESAEGKNNTGSSLADEITKLKGLLDCGILTQEEFDRAKNKLIDMM